MILHMYVRRTCLHGDTVRTPCVFYTVRACVRAWAGEWVRACVYAWVGACVRGWLGARVGRECVRMSCVHRRIYASVCV